MLLLLWGFNEHQVNQGRLSQTAQTFSPPGLFSMREECKELNQVAGEKEGRTQACPPQGGTQAAGKASKRSLNTLGRRSCEGPKVPHKDSHSAVKTAATDKTSALSTSGRTQEHSQQ